MHSCSIFFVFSLALWISGCQKTPTEQAELSLSAKPRTIVTTDGEIDDVDSFIRLLLYANEFHLEGLVYSSSMWHYKGDGTGTTFVSEMEMTRELYGERTALRWPGTNWMQELIAEYEKVYPILQTHAEDFPKPDYLTSIIRVGNIDFEGAMAKDTEGSDWIKFKLLDDNNPAPIYLQVWGGTNTIARALQSIEEEYAATESWEAIYRKVSQKAIIYTILDQDATYHKYISKVWPDIRVFYNSNQFWCFAYPWKEAVPKEWHYYLQGDFMGPHIINNHGPLTKKYYSYGDGQQQPGDPEHIHGDSTKLRNAQWGDFRPYDFISEGDSPAFLHLVDVGLDNLDHPHYGGWGGRLVQSETQPNRWEDGEAAMDFNPFTGQMDATYPQTRWIKVLQNDFAARADWCILPYEQANHPPQVSLKEGKHIKAPAGSTLILTGQASDPDGDELSYRWWQYHEVDSYAGQISFSSADQANTRVVIPEDMTVGENIHIILEVSDQRPLPITRYQRLIIECIAPE